MRRSFFMALLTLVALTSAHPRAQRSEHEQAVRAQVEAFGAAFRAADAEALATMLDPNYIHTNNGGAVLTAARWLDYVRTRRAATASGDLRLASYENSNIEVRLHRDTAIVTGRNVTEGTERGERFRRDLRFTQVWILRDGRWRRVAFHDTAVTSG